MKACVASALVAAFLVSVAPAIARAESSDEAEITAMAKEHYKLGLDAYKNGKYPEAIKELKKAYLLKRLPALLLNIGATYRKMGDIDNSVYYYKKYLAEAPDAKDRGEVEKTLAELDHEKPGAGANASSAAEAPSEAAAPAATGEWKHNPVDAAPPDSRSTSACRCRCPRASRSTSTIAAPVRRTSARCSRAVTAARRSAASRRTRWRARACSITSRARTTRATSSSRSARRRIPNIVRIDESAAPQVVAAGSGGGEAASGGGAHSDLDDEAAPITGEIAEEAEEAPRLVVALVGRRAYGALRRRLLGGRAGRGLGVASFAIGSYFLYQAQSYSNVLTADSQYRDPNTGQPYKFSDRTPRPTTTRPSKRAASATTASASA